MSKTTKPYKLSSRARVVPKEQRHRFPPEAFEDRNTKVRVSIFLDLDVLNFFKSRAKHAGALPYQTQINAALRQIAEASEGKDAAGDLRQAKGLIDAAIRKMG